MTSEEMLAAHMTMLERWDDLNEAKRILYRLTSEINRTGGNRQRGEGIKLIARVLRRLTQRMREVFGESPETNS